ncbi:mechanosensitive ion channel protein MscS [Lewinellaceae bacterium SD302]|nr:mechanosensitive ion channel protein MscS [Lewinellaceae bacterium SD302]
MFFQQNQDTPQDTPQEVDFNPGILWEKLDSWLDGAVRILPNLLVGIVVFIIFYFIARLIRRMLEKRLEASGRANLGHVAGGFVKWIILIAGFLFAATIVMPTLSPGDLIAGLGVSSVAIGFAFQDILQNWLAGILILLRQPFEIGDQIVVNGFEGSVERIETRATIIRQYNHERVVIPNSDIYTNAVKVKTANKLIRSQYDIGIGYGDDMQEAVEVLRKAVKGLEGVSSEKDIDVLPWDLAASWVTIRVRWWTNSARANVVQVHARVMKAIKQALDEAKIDMPYETQVHLFHDQTEETDGDRNAQREGWPAPKEGNAPRPRAVVEREKKEKES